MTAKATDKPVQGIARWENEGGARKKPPKRPRDANQLAKRIVDIATGKVEDREPTPEEEGKDPKAVARGKLGGSKGGTSRAATLTPEQRVKIARTAAQTRWKKS